MIQACGVRRDNPYHKACDGELTRRPLPLTNVMLTLYHVEWCPDCEIVRRKLSDLNLAYQSIVVPDFRPLRKEVFAVSGQYYVPVLQDGETVLSETEDILAHLEGKADTYGLANG